MAVVGDVRKDGPSVLDGDTWDIPPGEPLEWDVSALADDSDNNPYRGTRRARRRSGLRRRRGRRLRRVLLGVGVAALVGWLAGASAGATGDGTRTRWATAGALPIPLGALTVSPSLGAPSQVASARPPIATPVASTRPTGSAGSGASAQDAPSAAEEGAPPTSGAPLTFGPVSYEAEAGLPTTHLFGSAQVVAVAGAAGGQAVQGVGNWGGQTGSLRFQTVSVPATGTYRITISYVAEEVARTSTLTVSGGDTVNLTFATGTGCCATTTVDITLIAGTNQITLANPSGPVPLIDRVVVGVP
jgi:Carbohydrate binding module (family 35)